MKTIFKLKVMLSLSSILLLSSLFSLSAEAQEFEGPKAFQDLMKMQTDMNGVWLGEAEVYDQQTGQIRHATFRREMGNGPLPHTFYNAGYTEWEDGTRIPGYEIMGVREDGALLRQMVFQGNTSSYKEEVVIDYAFTGDNEWTLTFLEYMEGVQGINGPGIFQVLFEYSGDKLIITRSIAYGAKPDRDWEVRAEFYRQEEAE